MQPTGERVGFGREDAPPAEAVLLLQPSADDVAGMGLNLMARSRRVDVTERSRKTTALALRELRGSKRLVPERTRRRTDSAPRRTRPAAAASRTKARAA
jgi:NTE family protein